MAFALRAGFAWDQERKIPRDALAVVPFAQEAGNIAYALVSGEGFSSPFRNHTGPTAWLAPVYPVILAGIFRLFGPLTIPALNAAVVLNILCSAATCVPIFYLGQRLGGRATGALAAWFWTLLPAAVMLPFEWIWDTSLSALLAALLLWMTLRIAESPRWQDWARYGLLWGFSLLTNVALGALFFPWLAWAAYRFARGNPPPTSSTTHPHAARLAALAALLALLCCLPWTARNYLRFHKFIPIRSTFSFELWSGNNNIFDPHTGNAMARITLYGEVRQYTQLGETAFMADKWRKATLFIRTHPQLEAKLLLGRIIATWFGTQHPINDFLGADSWLPRVVFAVNAFLFVGMLVGSALLLRRPGHLAFPLVAAVIVFPVVYYVTHTSLRYRHPLDPVLIVLTALACTAPFRKTSAPNPAQRSQGSAAP